MSDNQKPLIEKPSETPVTAAAAAAPKPPGVKVVYARKIHSMIALQFLIILGLVVLSYQFPDVISTFQNIWLVFSITVAFVIFGVFMTLSVVFEKRNTPMAIVFLVFLTLSMAYFIIYLAASAASATAGYVASFMMFFINLVYMIVAYICNDPITPEIGILTGFIGSLLLDGCLVLGDVFIYGTDINDVSYLALGVIFFMSVLYSVYIFCSIKGMADAAKEAISTEDYLICGITVYLDFSMGLIIAISRQICSLLAG